MTSTQSRCKHSAPSSMTNRSINGPRSPANDPGVAKDSGHAARPGQAGPTGGRPGTTGMPSSQACGRNQGRPSAVNGHGRQNTHNRSRSKSGSTGQTLNTWVFDSVGPRKYALQVRKAANGNPSVRIIEGLPQDDGTYRKFNITVWSEDFQQFFEMVDELRNYLTSNNIKTPPGHKYRPKPRRSNA